MKTSMTMKNLKYLFIASIFIFLSCSKEDREEQNASMAALHEYLTPEVVDAMVEMRTCQSLLNRTRPLPVPPAKVLAL